MPDTGKLSRYLKAENAKDGDVITFIDAGVIVEKTFKKDEPPKPALEISVKFRGETKTYSPNGTTVKLLNAAWGTATEKWVGRSASLYIVPMNDKNVIIAKPKDGKAAPADAQTADAGDDVEEVPF